MIKNMGMIDRVVRVVLALAVAVLYLTGTISGVVAILLGGLALVLLLTGIVGFCPLYRPFNFSTLRQS